MMIETLGIGKCEANLVVAYYRLIRVNYLIIIEVGPIQLHGWVWWVHNW